MDSNIDLLNSCFSLMHKYVVETRAGRLDI